jgi:hypothetical protein
VVFTSRVDVFGDAFYRKPFREMVSLRRRVRHHLCDFKKKLVDQVALGYAQPYSNFDKVAKRRWHTDIDRRSLVWKILSGARLSRREEALPVSCES